MNRGCLHVGRGLWLAPVLSALLFCASQAWAQPIPALVANDAPQVQALAGAWDVVAPAANRRCRIQLNGTQPDRPLLVAVIKPQCRTTIPELKQVLNWGMGKDGRILLLTSDAREVLAFESRKQTGDAVQFAAGAGSGEILLEAAGQPYDVERRAQSIGAAVPAGQAKALDPAIGTVAGRYLITRDSRQPGCALMLGPDRGIQANTRKAALQPGCIDVGLTVFDPVGWRVEGERLFLVARKGHSIGFSKTPDGHFFKDPAQGRPLVMMRGKAESQAP